jgi:ferredoxin-NADP reductase
MFVTSSNGNSRQSFTNADRLRPLRFGYKGGPIPLDFPENPPLSLIPIGEPVKVPVVAIQTLKPDTLDNRPPQKADVFVLTLDITKTRLVDENGNPQLWPGQHLRIKGDIPSTLPPDYAQYLETMQQAGPLPDKIPLEKEEDRKFLSTRPYSLSEVEKRPDGSVWAMIIVRRLENGLRSNFTLANKAVGDFVKITAALRNKFLLPPRKANMIAVGIGIANTAPLQYMLKSRLERQGGELGQTYLYSGYKSWKDVLSGELYHHYTQEDRHKFHYREAFSRDPKPGEPKQHVHNLLTLDAETILALLKDSKTYVYICGVAELANTIEKSILELAQKKGKYTYWEMQARINHMKETGRWRAEGSQNYQSR